MFHLRIPSKRLIGMFGLVLLLSLAAYGFAAANTVPVSSAGDGQNTISGYTVSSVTYTLNSTTPSTIDSVSFTITPAAGGNAPANVKAKLVSSSSTWTSCTNTSGTTWSCAPSGGVSASSADELRVVAAQ
ncbi:hypothetical protein SE17_35435 [Kouleothrix aurantiaca]|uniref:Uncharacterized protein n=1 Tax=Kouleothrix aurantiaca TaxID=186479 RepID=A0A0P9D8U3_9CHLR|nr:hypothetical protein SE17_35435 [Kouleothrix aurantiaca]